MVIERFLFQPPNPPDYNLTSHGDHLLWLPCKHSRPGKSMIPSMVYSPSQRANVFIIWCHGNSCDIGTLHKTWKKLSQQLRAHILVFEYPSYGLLQGSVPLNRDSINFHADCAYSYVHNTLGWPINRIIMYGHSIGTGVACHIASTRNIGGLILHSPYTSIKSLVKEKVPFLPSFIANSYWNNVKACKNIRCPTLIIHGALDRLIPPRHSQILYSALTNVTHKQLVLLPNDDHNSMSEATLVSSIKPFLNEFFPHAHNVLPRLRINSSLRLSSSTVRGGSSMLFPTAWFNGF